MKRKKSLIVGGSNGIGLAITLELQRRGELVCVVDREFNHILQQFENICYQQVNLLSNDFSFLANHEDIDRLVITAGFGRICDFENITEAEIQNCFQVNSIATIKILHHFFSRMKLRKAFECAVIGSVAGMVSSPLIALYGGTKAALCNIIESLNIELEMSGSPNRILNVSPGFIKGTRFYGGINDMDLTKDLAMEILERMGREETLYIPQFEEVYKDVLNRYHHDPHQFGIESYQYKKASNRMNNKPQVKIGYLSGTFDLFHIGHLNLLRRAKQYCDYLVVGVHQDATHKGKRAFIPYEERVDIVGNIKYVDKVIPSEKEDSDVYAKGILKYDYLFVGSDYQGTERFNRYEAYFADKGVKIIYFPYTQETNSTQLREALLAINSRE